MCGVFIVVLGGEDWLVLRDFVEVVFQFVDRDVDVVVDCVDFCDFVWLVNVEQEEIWCGQCVIE